MLLLFELSPLGALFQALWLEKSVALKGLKKCNLLDGVMGKGK